MVLLFHDPPVPKLVLRVFKVFDFFVSCQDKREIHKIGHCLPSSATFLPSNLEPFPLPQPFIYLNCFRSGRLGGGAPGSPVESKNENGDSVRPVSGDSMEIFFFLATIKLNFRKYLFQECHRLAKPRLFHSFGSEGNALAWDEFQ